MASRLRLQFLVVALLVLGLGMAWLEEPRQAEAAALPTWTGGVNLYRNGTFTTQKSWLWCTAAGVQIVRNIVDRRTDHTTAGQRRYFDWMRGAQPLRPAAVRRRGPGRLDRRPAPLRGRPLPAGVEPDLRFGASVGRHPAAPDQPAGRADRLARQPRLDPDRLPGDGRSGEDLGFHGHERPGDRAALRPPEQERLRHGTEHEADDRPAQALLHAVEVRPAGDDLGRPLRLDPAGAGQGGGCRERVGAPSRAASSAPSAVASQAPVVAPSPSPAAPSSASAAPAVALLASDRPDGSGCSSRPLIPSRQRTHPRLRSEPCGRRPRACGDRSSASRFGSGADRPERPLDRPRPVRDASGDAAAARLRARPGSPNGPLSALYFTWMQPAPSYPLRAL